MIRIGLIRHGETAWNTKGRIQGRTDVPLSETGRAAVRAWSLPGVTVGWQWFTSPLTRAVETAALLGVTSENDERLCEMHWGEWEGERIADLRARLGRVMAENEARGLDFQPPGGEAPRDVRDRVAGWVLDVADSGRDTGAITHKGVIRAVLCLATGWDMTGKEPVKLRDGAIHLFSIAGDGSVTLDEANVPLETEDRG